MNLYLTLLITTLAAGLAAPGVARTASTAAEGPRAERAEAEPQVDIPGATQMLYTAVQPCRLLDTRIASARGGRLPAGAERDFLVYDADLFAEQGGAEGGCELPQSVRAVVINLTAVDAEGRGFVTVWDFGKQRPPTANINLIPGEDVNNQLTVAVNTDPGEEDLTIYSFASTHLVADIVGYYTQLVPRALECQEVRSDNIVIEANSSNSALSPMCPAGYSRTGGSCGAASLNLRMVSSRSSNTGLEHLCVMRNDGPSNAVFWVEARCCRVPGG